MEASMTIAEAAQAVLRESRKTMSTTEIYDEIVRQNLYSFGAKNPKSVMSQAIRERSDANPKAKQVLFRAVSQGTYELVE